MITDQQRATATRAETVASIKAAGFHRKFPLSEPFLQSLLEYFQNMEAGNMPLATAKSFTSVVSRYLYYNDPRNLNTLYITDKREINKFTNDFKNRTTAAASTIKNALSAIKGASAYMKSENLPRTDSHSKICKGIVKLKNSLNVPHTQRKTYFRRHRLSVDASTPDLEEAPEKLQALAPHIKDLMSRSGISYEERNTVTSYLVSRLALENSSRSSHITNLSMAEFHEGELCGTDYICTCTFSKTGLAPVTFTPEMLTMTRKYIREVRSSIPDASCAGTAPVFLSNVGTRMQNISSERHLYKILKLASVGRRFSLTQLRKAITTKASRMFADTPGLLGLVNRYQCHSDPVANQYYTEALRTGEYQRGFQLIQRILNIARDQQAHIPPVVVAPTLINGTANIRQCHVQLIRL